MKTKTRTKKDIVPTTGKKQRTKNIIIASAILSAAGILGYFGWQYYKKKKVNSSKNAGEPSTDINKLLQSASSLPASAYPSASPVYTPPKTTSSTPRGSTGSGAASASGNTASNSATSSNFPLKKGSRGENVRLLQQALITKYGKSILPRYGADGDFGTETLAALKKAGLPDTVTESTFNVLTQGTRPDTTSIGKDLYNAASSKNYTKAIALLKQLQSVEDYTKASEEFKQYRLGSVRQTLVNGLLNTFTSTSQKESIRMEFLRIGLQYDGNKWSLSGFDGRPIMTQEATTVWINATDGIPVPARMVLGAEVTRRLDYTLFENNGRYFLVHTKAVQYLS